VIRWAETHPDWALGFADAVWWSRWAQPNRHRWTPPGGALRWVEKTRAQDDPDPQAIAGYGLLVRATTTPPDRLWLRFATGQPVSGSTTQFLAWGCEQWAMLGKPALLLVWDNASWHKSQAVRNWLRTHNRTVKQPQPGVRILSCRLPSKSPWLNPIEPQWVHGKRAVLEPERVLTAAELETRV
jgi:hypothetical protein